MSMKAEVTDITRQDGSCLTESLLSNGYVVFGRYRSTRSFNFGFDQSTTSAQIAGWSEPQGGSGRAMPLK